MADEYKEMRQDVYDFMVQLKTYSKHPDPITMTLDTLRANLGTKTANRIERHVALRMAEVHPRVFNV